MSFPVKYFHGAQTGAPVMSGTAGALIALLDGVLINGFNTKTFDSLVVASNVATANISAGSHGFSVDDIVLVNVTTPVALNEEWKITAIAGTSVTFSTTGIADQTATGAITLKIAPVGGWSKLYTGTNKAVYKSTDPAASVGMFRVDDTVAQSAQIRGYEAMTDVDTGTNQCPSAAWLTTNVGAATYGIYKSSTANGTSRNWWLIADSRMIFMGVAGNSSNPNVYLPAIIGDFNTYKAGDNYAFTVMCHSTTGSSYDIFGTVSNHSARGGSPNKPVLRNMVNTGQAAAHTQWTAALGSAGVPGLLNTVTYPALSDNGVHLHRVFISDADTTANGSLQRRGDMPGYLVGEEYLAGTHLQKITYGGKSYITMGIFSNSSNLQSNAFFSLDAWR